MKNPVPQKMSYYKNKKNVSGFEFSGSDIAAVCFTKVDGSAGKFCCNIFGSMSAQGGGNQYSNLIRHMKTHSNFVSIMNEAFERRKKKVAKGN